jgi:hypothetical protein
VSLAQYFSQRLYTEAWDNAPDVDRKKAEAQAQRELEPYRGKTNPVRFSYAVAEQALWLLEGNTRSKLQQAGVKNASISGVSESFNLRGRPPNIAPQAWAYLKAPKNAVRIT